MRTYPEDASDSEELARLNVEPWQSDLLKLNPSYVFWGPHEDYMWKEGEGWDSRITVARWKDNKIGLDELNEVANFYFKLTRDAVDCDACGGRGLTPEARRIDEQWYGKASFDPVAYGATPLTVDHPALVAEARRQIDRSPGYYGTGEAAVQRECRRLFELWRGQWCHHLIQADVDALVAADRLWDFTRRPRTEEQKAKLAETGGYWMPEGNGHTPTADEVNAWSLSGIAHDAINSWACVRARCEREGIPMTCPKCDGHGHLYTAERGHVELVLWLLHPRKGASRGVEYQLIEQDDLPSVFAFLREARDRNAERFAKVPV